MPVYKKNDKYFAKVNYKDSDGKYKSKQSKYFETKREAKEEEARLLQSIGKVSANDIPFSVAYKELETTKELKGVKDRTRKNDDYYYKALDGFVNKEIGKITQNDVDELKKKLKDKYKENTLRNALAFVKSVVLFGSQKYKIQNNYLDFSCPTSKKPKSNLNFLTQEEFNLFIAQVQEEEMKTFYELLFYNGLRVSEARGLTFSAFDGKHITIDKQYIYAYGLDKTLKTNNSYRALPLNPSLVERFNKQREYYSTFIGFDENWYIFGGLQPLTVNKIRDIKDEALKKAHVKRIRIHDFRHSCASFYIHLNYPIHLIAELLGDDVNTVYKTYYHLYRSDLSEMINSVEIRG